MHTIDTRQARRLALIRSGLLKPEWTGLPARAGRTAAAAKTAAHAVVRRFGYLQLDTVSVAGARSHAIVLASRLAGFRTDLGEELLHPGAPLFEYWGHEACWLPLELYPAFEFRRREFRKHPWWGNVVGAHPQVARDLLHRIREEGPLRSVDMEGQGGRGWWDLKLSKRVATALWSSGELAIAERRNFHRTYDLAERVIPEELRNKPLPKRESFALLFETALSGQGWATTGGIAATWRLRNRKAEIVSVLHDLVERGRISPCLLASRGQRPVAGWIRTPDLELAARAEGIRPRSDRAVLLSPFDPLLWDRARTRRLFGFEQVLEIFKPAEQRQFGYFCLPVLAGERLVARVDLKAERARGRLTLLSCRFEEGGTEQAPSPVAGEMVRAAVQRHAEAAGLELIQTGTLKAI